MTRKIIKEMLLFVKSPRPTGLTESINNLGYTSLECCLSVIIYKNRKMQLIFFDLFPRSLLKMTSVRRAMLLGPLQKFGIMIIKIN